MKVVVLMGGKSSEREISIKTGEAVSRALERLGHEVYKLDLSEDIAEKLLKIKPDKVFIALHGHYGEDGRIQGLLDILGIPYVGSGVLGSAISMDKDITKRLLKSEGIPTPEWITVRKNNLKSITWDTFPAVVKPADQGSSIGLKVVKNQKELNEAVKEAFELSEKVIIERFIEGRDMTVGILKGKVLPVIEIRPKKGIYDFESKYTKGMSEYVFVEDKTLSEKLQKISLRIFEIFELKDLARIDFRVDREGNPYVLEVNTIPGMTELSLFPMACKRAGLSFDEMIEELLRG